MGNGEGGGEISQVGAIAQGFGTNLIPDLRLGQVVLAGGKYLKVAEGDEQRKLVEVVPVKYTLDRRSYLAPFGLIYNQEKSRFEVNQSSGERVPVGEGVTYEDGEHCRELADGRVEVVKYTDEIYSNGMQKVVYKEGRLFLVNSQAASGDHFSYMINREFGCVAEVPINIGDEVVLRDGGVMHISQNEDGSISYDFLHGGLDEADRQRVAGIVAAENGGDLINAVTAKMKLYGCREKLLLNEVGDQINIEKYFNTTTSVYLVNAGLAAGMTPQLHSIIVMTMCERSDEFKDLVGKTSASLYQEKAIRYRYGLERLKYHRSRNKLEEFTSGYEVPLEGLSLLWDDYVANNGVLSGGVVEQVMSILPDAAKEKIGRLTDKVSGLVDDDETRLAIRKWRHRGMNTSILPQNFVSLPDSVRAILIEEELSNLAFAYKKEAMAVHREDVSMFWSKVFENGISQPDNFRLRMYDEESMQLFFRACGNTEMHAGGPGVVYLDLDNSPEYVTRVADHEANHEILSSRDLLPISQKEVSTLQATVEEPLVEWLKQLYVATRTRSAENMFDGLVLGGDGGRYQGGVNEIQLVLEEMGGAERLAGIHDLLQGIVDYSSGSSGNPFDYLNNRYERLTGKNDLVQRIRGSVDLNSRSRELVSPAPIVVADEVSVPLEMRGKLRGGVLVMDN